MIWTSSNLISKVDVCNPEHTITYSASLILWSSKELLNITFAFFIFKIFFKKMKNIWTI